MAATQKGRREVYVPVSTKGMGRGKAWVRDAVTNTVIRVHTYRAIEVDEVLHAPAKILDEEGGVLLVVFSDGPTCWVPMDSVRMPVLVAA